MKKSIRSGLGKSILIFLTVCLNLFSACEIGLGPAVDTEAPILTIVNPPVDAIVRDEFAIKGTWEDDGAIASVTVTLKRPDGFGSTISYEATVSETEGEGDWYAVVNPFTDSVLDGTYEATVEISDEAGHVVSQTRTFTVDNTAPLIVLQRPGTKITETADAYGQTFSLNGMGADDNSIDHIDVQIYSDEACTNLLKTITKSNVPPTIELEVAVFEEGVSNDYSEIYGSTTKNGTQYRYCKITAYDNAKRYPLASTGSPDEERGNSTSKYYLYDDIYTGVLENNTITDVYKMLSGTYLFSSQKRNAGSIEEVKSILARNEMKESNFSLNPENNPLFIVNGKDVLRKDGADFTGNDYLISNGAGVVVEIATGLDGISLNAASLRPYLIPCDANGDPSVSNVPENRIYLADAGTGQKSGTSYKFTVSFDTSFTYPNDKHIVIGGTYIFGVEGSDQRGNTVRPKDGDYGFKLATSGAAPIVEVEACINPGTGDNATTNNYTSDTMIYVPRFRPEVTPQQESVIRFKGTAYVDEGTPTITMSIDSGDSIIITPTQNSGSAFSFETDVPVSSFSDPSKSGQHNIVFNVTQGLSTRVTKSIMYQPDAPSITLSRVEPTAYNYRYGTGGALVESGIPEKITVNGTERNKKYLNGKNVKLNVTIIAGAVGINERDESKKAKIEFFQNGARVGNAIDAPTFGETDNIDTTAFAEGELLIRITAYDMAGNKAVYEDTYYVKQDTDDPVILPKNTSNTSVLLSQAEAQSESNTSVNVYSSNQMVSYRLIDDDGLDSVQYVVRRASASAPDPVKQETISLNGNTDYQLDITMPETPDIYKVTVYTKDINTLTTTGSAYKDKTNEFFVRITASAPVIEPIELNRTIVKASDTISPLVKIRSDQKPFRLLRVVKNKTTGAILEDYKKVYTFDGQTISLAANDTNGRDAFSSYGFDVDSSITTEAITALNTESPEVTDTIDISSIPASGSYTICYKVIDKNTKTGEASKDITVDLNAPNITEVKIDGNGSDALYNPEKWYNSKTLSLAVKAADGTGESGISSVDYSTNGTLWTSLSYDNDLQAYAGSAVFGSEGDTNSLYIRAKDNAGNIKYFNNTTANGTLTSSSVNVKIDTSAPVLSVVKYQIGTLPEVTEMTSSRIYVKNGVTLKIWGTYSDAQSLINQNSLQFFFGDSTTPTEPTTVNKTAGTWDVTFTISDSMTLGNFKVKVKNNANAETVVNPFEVIRDSTPPTLKNISLTTDSTNTVVYKDSASGEYYVNNTENLGTSAAPVYPKFTITGIAADNTGVSNVTLTIGSDTPQTSTASDFSFANLDWHEKTGTITAIIKATDIAGNESPDTVPAAFAGHEEYKKVTLTIHFDTSAPKAKHRADAQNKDIYFRIGKADNEKNAAVNEWETGDAVNDNNNPKNQQVGKKYSYDSWGTDTSIEIRGTFEETGSGIKTIHYAIFDYEPTSTQIENLEKGILAETDSHVTMISNFLPLTTPEMKKVPYSTSSGRSSQEVTSNFRTSIPGFNAEENYLVLVAEDNVGNRAADALQLYEGSAAGNNVWNSSKSYYKMNKDNTPPEITSVTGSDATGAANVALAVAIKEKNLDSVEVVIKKDGSALTGATQQATIGTITGTGENRACTITIPFATGITINGVYDIEIKAKDKAGNISPTTTKRITRDDNPPTVTIDNPAANTSAYSTTNSGNNMSFRINASDGDSGVGVSKLYYAFSTNDTAPESTRWKTVENFAGGDYTIDMPLISGRTPVLSTNGDVTSISEGVWYLYAKAEDKSGNITTTANIPKRRFHVDKAAPALNFTGNSASLTEGSRNVIDAVGTDTAGTSGYVFSGTVSDTNQLNSLVLTVDGATPISLGTDGTWTRTIATGDEVGTLRANRDINIQFVATDIAGKTTTKNFIIYYDTAAPELEITSPAANEPVETPSKAIKGTVVDNGYGVDRIEYTLKRETTTINSSTDYPVTITGEQWYIAETVNNGKIPLGTTEGSLTLEVTAHEKTVDTHGGRTSTQTVNFYYDKANPGLEETGIGTTGTTTNSDFTFAGKAWDSNDLESITIKCGSQTWVSTTENSNINITGATKLENAPSANNWTATFVTGTAHSGEANYIADGTKEFTIIAKDISGKEKQLTRTVVVDTTPPTVSEATITTASTPTANTTTWYKTRTLSISGTVSDTGSGVTRVECIADGDTVWTPLSTSNGTYSGSITFADDGTDKDILVRAFDVAGNQNSSTTSGIKIDTTAPALVEDLSSVKINGRDATNTIFTIDVTEEFSGVLASGFTVLLGNTSLSLDVEAAGGANTTNNRISIGAPTGTGSNKKYPVTIQIGNNAFSTLSGSYPVKVTVADQAGNVSASTIIKNLTVDGEPPVPTFTSHNANATVNKTITLGGRVTDASNSTITAMSLTATSGTGNGAVTKTFVYPAPAAGSSNGTINYENGQWSVNLDTTEFYNSTATQALSLSLTATDDASNTCTAVTRTLTIDQNSDRPVLSLTNLPWDNTANSTGGAVKEYNKNLENLTGIITDDDGISELRIAVADTKPAELATNDDYLISVNSTGAFSVPLGSNGSKTLWIYVKDTKNGVFETEATGTNATLSQPYLVFNGHKDLNNRDIKSDDSTATTFKINNNSPLINKTKFGFYGTTAEGTVETAPAQYYEFDNTNNYAGGTVRKNVVFEITAIPSTNVPIDSVSLSVTGLPAGTSFTFTKAGDTTVGGLAAEIWRSAAVDVKSETNPWTSGTKSLTYTVVDKSGLSATSETKQLVIDNEGPTVTLISPGGDEVTGVVTLSGSTTDDHTVDELRFKVVDNRYFSSYDTLNSNAQTAVNNDAKTANTLNAQTNNSTFSFELNGTAVGSNVNPRLPTSTAGVQDTTSGINLAPRPAGYGENDDTRQLIIVFYAKDSLGNETYTPMSGTGAKSIIYNPFADRPKATVSYPTGLFTTSYDTASTNNLSVLNGLIRVTGYAEDNVSVRNGKVYLQFDLDKDGDFDATDLATLKGLKKNGTEIIYTNIKEGISVSDTGVTNIDVLGSTAAANAFWGYPVIGTNSWNCLINQTNEMQINEADIGNGRYLIGVRAVAIDDTGVLGSWSAAQYFIIDRNAPIMSTASFRNRETGAENSNSDIVRTYVSDMYLSGTQTLIIPVSDTSGIVKVNYAYAPTLSDLYATGVHNCDIDSNSSTDGRLTFISETPIAGDSSNSTTKNYEVEIPVSDLAEELNSSQLALKVTVYQGNTNGDISGTTAYERYVFNFDNTAPTVSNPKFNGRTYDTDEDTHKVYNSNGSFTIAGTASDEGSGFERFAFYFYKNSGESSALGERIYDPVVATTANTASVNQPNFINVNGSGVTYREVTDSTSSSLKAKIYGFEKSLNIASDGLTMTGYTSTNADHINPGSLVEIGGVWYKIASISGGTITLSSPTTLTGSQTVFFAYIMSLDNTETERGTLATESQGDGDKMVESVVKKNTSWEYDGQLYSNYIPDGPKNLRTFVWDKAGNLTIKTYDVQVENNAPRLTKVWLATDLNDNSKFEDSEFTAYNILSKTSGNVQSSFNLETGDYGLPRFRVLKDLAVVTEFVGGNAANSEDDIFLAFNNDVTANPDNGKLTKTNTNWHGSSTIGGTNADIKKTALSFESEHSTYSGALARSNKGYVLRNEDLGYTITGYDKDSVKQANGEFTNRAMSFTFWDSTEDTTPGTDSCYCYLKISDLIVLLADNEEPNISIDPFFWNTPDENSLYKNSYLNGHIDLSKDLMSNPQLASTYEKPKVSGKISVRGSASDAHFLSEIWMKFSNFTVANGLTSANTAPGTGAVCVAKRVDGVWTYPTVASTEISGGNVGFKVTKETSTQQGHYIEWQLDFDTSAMSTGCLENAVLNMWAIDKADSPHHSSGTATTGTTPGYEVYSAVDYNIPNYEMSVVPYISKVQDANGNDAVRSRLGRYPVRTGSTITIKGFNFPTGTPSVQRWKTGGTSAEQTITTGVTRVDSTTVTMTAPANSGYIKLVWTGAETPNNDNTNAGYNISKGYIASEKDENDNKTYGSLAANQNGTNFWTDDVYLSVWNTGTYFEGSASPHSGTFKKFTARDLDSGKLYKQQSKSDSILTYANMTDHYMALWGSDDMLLYSSIKGSTEHAISLYTQSEYCFNIPPEAVIYTVIGGIPYYVLRDDWVGGNSANSWGTGLILAREGYDWKKGTLDSTNSLTENDHRNIIEREGNNNPAASRNSTGGYDSVLKQFTNFQMTGYYASNETINRENNSPVNGVDYVYVSYYDSYARCLKYAAFKAGHRTTAIDPSQVKWGQQNGYQDLIPLMRTAGEFNESGTAIHSTAQGMTGGYSVVAGNDTTSSNPTSFAEQAGEWSDIVIDPVTKTPVIVYYNKTEGNIEIAHAGTRKAPSNGQWIKTTNLTKPEGSSDFGRYVSCAVDNSGNLHVTAQDASNGRLYYMYLTKNTSTYKYTVTKTVLVDATGAVGRWTDIELTTPSATGEAAKPVISYLDTTYLNTTKAVKVAYYDAGKECWDALTDCAVYEGYDTKLSVMADVYESTAAGSNKSQIGVGFNSNMLAVDFLRGE